MIASISWPQSALNFFRNMVFATVSNCSEHGYGSQQNRRFTVTPPCHVGLALACDFYRGNGKAIHNVEIPPVRTSVCPAFGRKQLNECPRWREFLGQPSRQEKYSDSSAVSSGFASSSVFFMVTPSITPAVFIFEALQQLFFWRIIYQTKITHTLLDTYIEITAAIALPPCFSSCCYTLNWGLV